MLNYVGDSFHRYNRVLSLCYVLRESDLDHLVAIRASSPLLFVSSNSTYSDQYCGP